MSTRAFFLTLATLFAPMAQGEICDGIPARPQEPARIQVPCTEAGWMHKDYPGHFALCLPDDLIESSSPGDSTISAHFERSDLSVLIDYSQYADDLMHYQRNPDYLEWASIWWEPMWMRFVSFTSDTDAERPYRIASFVPNIDTNLRLNIFVFAKNCDGIRQGYALLRSVAVTHEHRGN